MKIIYKNGDLLKASERFLCQGCNAGKNPSGPAMNSGVAKLIRAKWPHVYEEYISLYKKQGNVLHLGQIIPVECDDKIVLNLITQEYYGRDPNVVYVSYDAIRTAIKNLSQTYDQPIAFPLIGAGLAHGSWKIISEIIEEESINFQPVVYLNGAQIPHE